MGYMGAIGIGAALSALPQGILQGEEIKRRRDNEDEQRAMAKLEFENRQTVFGRQKKEWGNQDLERQVSADLQAGVITKDQAYQRMADGGIGDAALRLRGTMTQLSLGEQNLEQGAEMFKLNKRVTEGNIRQQEMAEQSQLIVGSIMSGDYQASAKRMNDVLDKDPNHQGRKIISLSPLTDSKGRLIKDDNGVTQLAFKYIEKDGTEHSKVFDAGQAGAFLGPAGAGLQALAARESTLNHQNRTLAIQNGMLHDARQDRFDQRDLQRRQAEASPYQQDIVKMMSEKSPYDKQKAEMMASGGWHKRDGNGVVLENGMPVLSDGAKAIESAIASFNKDISHLERKRNAAFGGFKIHEYKDPNTGRMAIDEIRSIIPLGSTDVKEKVDFRLGSNSMYVTADGAPRLLAQTHQRLNNETDQQFLERMKRVAKSEGMSAGWYSLVAPKNGSSQPVWKKAPDHLGSDGKDLMDFVTELEKKGLEIVLPRGYDFGSTHPDVEQGNKILAAYGVSKSGSSVRAGSGGGRLPSGVSVNSGRPVIIPGMRK